MSSLDGLFERMELLTGRSLVELSDSFVTTTQITAVYLPATAIGAVQRYFPDYDIEMLLNEIRVTKGEVNER